jgi:hypothetical protein
MSRRSRILPDFPGWKPPTLVGGERQRKRRLAAAASASNPFSAMAFGAQRPSIAGNEQGGPQGTPGTGSDNWQDHAAPAGMRARNLVNRNCERTKYRAIAPRSCPPHHELGLQGRGNNLRRIKPHPQIVAISGGHDYVAGGRTRQRVLSLRGSDRIRTDGRAHWCSGCII